MKEEKIAEKYREKKSEIEQRLEEFRDLRSAPEERIFQELVFVILTSQTSAEKAWEAAKELKSSGKLLEGSKEEIKQTLEKYEITYPEEKAFYILENRKMFSQPTLEDPSGKLKIKDRIDPDNLDRTRKWLKEEVTGISWKGASHFLRNIGYGNGFAIVSGHIIRQMYELGLVDEVEPPTGRDKYLEVEEKLRDLSDNLGIDIKSLDLVLWSMRTGKVFK